jgi:glycosyltransferase involved in cell wall biosynthesis
MKVLLAAPTYLPSRRANTLQVLKMAQALQGIGHEIRVLVPDPYKGRIPNWESLSHHYGLNQKLDLFWLPVNSRFRSYDYGYKVIQQFRIWDADLLYTRLPQAAALGSTLKVPTIFEIHDLPGGRVGPWLLRVFLKGSGAQRLVVITKALRDALDNQVSSLPDAPFTIIAPDGVDLSRYENMLTPKEARESLTVRGHLQLPADRFTAGYTGSLYEGRGMRLILALAQHLTDMSFLIVGGAPDVLQALEAEVEQHQLENVILRGFVANVELVEYQSACDVLLMPYQEKVAASSGGDIAPYLSPMKLFEYLACGRVILSSDLPVLREILNESNAILLPPSDVYAWVNALREIKDGLPRGKALAAQARRDSERYTWEARAVKILSLPQGN